MFSKAVASTATTLTSTAAATAAAVSSHNIRPRTKMTTERVVVASLSGAIRRSSSSSRRHYHRAIVVSSSSSLSPLSSLSSSSWMIFDKDTVTTITTTTTTTTTQAQRFFSTQPKRAVDDNDEEEEKNPTKDKQDKGVSSSSDNSNNAEAPPLPVDFMDISRAKMAISGGVKRTECTKSYFLSELVGANVYLKFENQQFTGSFKERGARNAILQLIRERGSDLKGVIAASAGNHALALAYHGRELGIPVTVVMPVVAPLAKVDKCRKFGANVVIEGNHILESKSTAEALIKSNPGLQYINGFDDPPIIAGAGTIGQEIVEDVPNVDAVVVPVGGAGLIAGVACAVKTLKPDCKVFGVEPEFCASYIAAIKAGKPVAAPVQNTLADGLAVPVVGPHAFAVAKHYVDECVTVTEKEISLAVLRLVENEKTIVEGGGASGLAALLPGGALDRPDLKGKNIVVPLCGGNIDTTILGRVLERGLAADNRLCNFYAEVSDRPGGIARLTALLAEQGASIKDIYHERAWLHTNVDMVQVKCVVELNGKEHSDRLKRALADAGYKTVWKPTKGINSNTIST